MRQFTLSMFAVMFTGAALAADVPAPSPPMGALPMGAPPGMVIMRPPPDPILAPGDFDAAERAYEATLKEKPNDGAALAGLARIRLYQERRAEARKLAEQALAADQNNGLAKRVISNVGQREVAFAIQQRLAGQIDGHQ